MMSLKLTVRATFTAFYYIVSSFNDKVRYCKQIVRHHPLRSSGISMRMDFPEAHSYSP